MKATTATHQATVMPATRFRNQATGISPCREVSEMQGAARTAAVVQGMPADQRKALVSAAGYPTPRAARD